jgi:hypothetical protein
MSEENKRLDFLIEVYKTRIQFFSDHANRTWTRFNILLTVELAVSGLFCNALIDKGISTRALWLLPLLGVVVSLFWYVLGAQDSCAYLGYREQIKQVEVLVSKALGATDLPPFNPLGTKNYNPLAWRLKLISLSKLLSLFPLLFLVGWTFATLFITLRD